MASSTKESEAAKIQQCLWLVKTIRGTMIELQKKLYHADIPDSTDEVACKKFQQSLDSQTRNVEKWFNKLEDYFREMPERLDKLPNFSNEAMKRLQATFTDVIIQDDQTPDLFEDFLNSQNWVEGNQQFFHYSSELMRLAGRKRMSLMEKKLQTVSRWDEKTSPHTSFEKALRQVQSELNTKKLGMWPNILERSAFGCIFEIKYGLIVERQHVVQQKMLVVENCGQIEMVRFVAPHEEWSYFDDFGSRRVDLTKQSRYIVYQKLTSQANIHLQLVLGAINTDHKWSPNNITNLLNMFARYQSVFDTPCRHCGKIMKDFLPCVFDPRGPRNNAAHETCRV